MNGGARGASNKDGNTGSPSAAQKRFRWSPSFGFRFKAFWNLKDLLDAIKATKHSSTAVCIIEGITEAEGIQIEEDLGTRTGLFSDHLRPGHRVLRPNEENDRWRCIDVSYSYPPVRDERIRVSYWRLPSQYDDMYMFLVPNRRSLLQKESELAKHRKPHGNSRACLRVGSLTDSMDLTLPCLLEPKDPAFDISEFLREAMKSAWPRNCLFNPGLAGDSTLVEAHLLLYILADFAWAHNLVILNNRVKSLSFQSLQSPSMNTVANLHGLREDLSFLRAEVGKMLRYTPAELRPTTHSSNRDDTPFQSTQRTADDAKSLEKFLTSSLELLIASIALRDSQLAQRNSQRADILTVLVAVYVPLSFVTGIFGMNLRELNDSTLPLWVCLEVLGVVVLVTLVVGAVFWCIQKRGERTKRSEGGV